jgi:peptide/nickel transport system ATP-binding protein
MNSYSVNISLDKKNLVDIKFRLNSSLALVGQSGSGKSLTLKALLGMLPKEMHSTLNIPKYTMALVPQNPFTALSPLTKIKKQFFVDMQRVEELFEELGLELSLLDRFPPELSGGQLQRVVIAMALSNKPELLLLDEPTTALDPQTRVSILSLLKVMEQKEGFKMLFVTHDIASAKSLCKEICIIKDGKLMESGEMQSVLSNPKSSYTKTLIRSNFKNREFRK